MKLKELFHKLGVCQTTVNRALNSYREVAETTRNRVLQSAKTHDCQRGTRAKGLEIGKTFSIGHVIPHASQHEIVNRVFRDVITGTSGADHGPKSRGVVHRLAAMDVAHRHRAGIQDALGAVGMETDSALVLDGEMTKKHDHRSCAQMPDTATPPTAVLVASIISAPRACRTIDEWGLVRGRDVSVITHDDDLSCQGSGGDQPIHPAPRSSVRASGAHLEHKERKICH